MERDILSRLQAWKDKPDRKPLLLTGARQVGKTHILKEFGRLSYARTHYLNFEEEPGLLSVFEKDFKPARILTELGFHLGTSINPEADLIIFDEIQAAPKALTSLKYFAEEMRKLSVCGAGSLLGLHLANESFPVGKVEFLPLRPLTFLEFLRGTDETQAYTYLSQYDFNEPVPELIHARMWDFLKIYFVVGGMPEPVTTYAAHKQDTVTALEAVRNKQNDLIRAYLADVAKHSGKVQSMHIERVWQSVPAQLARALDDSSSKFTFQEIVPGIRGYARLVGAIDWLQAAGLILKLPIANKAWLPLKAYTTENTFKLYGPDTGLLGALGGLSPKLLLDFTFGSYKGYVAENFVLQEFTAVGILDVVCWKENTAEVEFLFEHEGTIIPVEVKSGGVTKAKSLKVFADKYQPPARVILGAGTFSWDRENRVMRLPLYLAGRLKDALRTHL